MTNEERSVKVNKIINDMTVNYRIGEGIVDIYLYRENHKRRRELSSMIITESGTYTIVETNSEGYIALKRKNDTVERKVLIRPILIKDFKEGDIIRCQLIRKVFFTYWNIDIFKEYICIEGDNDA